MSTDHKAGDGREGGSHNSRERQSSVPSILQVNRNYSPMSSLDCKSEPQGSIQENRQGLQGYAKEHNLRIATPTDSDYDSDSEFSLSGTPNGTPSRMNRWKSFKISSLLSRFQRQSTMPNRPQVPDSPRQDSFRSHDDILSREESKTYMVSYDSMDAMASPTKVISIRGLIKLCGKDTCGRPIVVIDTSYCPPAYMRFVALGHIREKMEPVVESGEYNLVFVMSPNPSRADTSKDVPAMWCLEVFRKLPYSYKKNVERVVIIHPTFAVKLVINLLRPFTSSKAHEKIIGVHCLAELDKATNGEVTLDKLYLATHVYLHDKTLTSAASPEDFTP